MANLDTRSKRASSVGILLPFLLSPVLPDGTIAQADRQHTAWSYSGILAAAASTITGLISAAITSARTGSAFTGATADPTITGTKTGSTFTGNG